MRRVSSWFLILTAALLYVACNSGSNNNASMGNNTIAENQERARLGLRLLGTNWCLYRAEFGEEDWKVASSDGWIAKKIHRDSDGKLVWEEDYYYSGRTFVSPKGQDWEMLTVHYDYGSSAITASYIGPNPAITSLFDRHGSGATNAQKVLDIEQILKTWGIPRL